MNARRTLSRVANNVGAGPRREGGQGLVEFAMLVPVFLLILLGMLEFGFAFNHNLTLESATREGARAGAAMADGSQKDTTCGGTILTAANVDPLVIAAVQRVLESPGSMVDMGQIQAITIYKVSNDGSIPSPDPMNVWKYRPGNAANPAVACQSPTQTLDFYEFSHGWDTIGRNNGVTPDSFGVRITYTYQFRSALGGILRFFGRAGASSLQMTDTTVMALEPTG